MKSKLTVSCTGIDCPERFSLCCGAGCTNGLKKEPHFICRKCRKEFKGGECRATPMMAACPKCKQRTYVVSVFGAVCSNEKCFYSPTCKACYDKGFSSELIGGYRIAPDFPGDVDYRSGSKLVKNFCKCAKGRRLKRQETMKKQTPKSKKQRATLVRQAPKKNARAKKLKKIGNITRNNKTKK